jgi:hypothetical protein
MINIRLKQTLKVFASCFIAAHLVAIFVAPASVAPTSPLISSTWSAFSTYLYGVNLNHGYHFFAPEPGASTLLEYRGTTSEGEMKHGILPDKQQMRPRLLYHRYFMLTEYLGSFNSGDPTRQPLIYNFARQLLENEGLDQVELKLVRHRPSTRQEILIGDELDSSETFEREPLGTFTWEKIQSYQLSSNK